MKKFAVLIFTLCLSMTFVPYVSAQSNHVPKAVFIIAQENFQDDEFVKPLSVLESSGISVTVASTTTGMVTGMNGAKTKPDILLINIKVDDYDAVVFIGGSGAAQYIDDPLAHKIAQKAVAKNKVVGAICLAPRILASAGVLKNKKATVYPSEGDKMKSQGVNYTAKPVEQDGNIITADGPGSAQKFGEALKHALKGNS